MDNAKIKIKGNHFFFSLPGNIKEDDKFLDYIRSYIRYGDYFNKIEKELKDFKQKENIIVTEGFSVLTERLTGGTTYTGEVTDGALGTGASPSFTTSDTVLNNEVGRKSASDAAFDNNIAYVDFFFASGDIADDTYTEWGTFIDGDGSTPGSGQAFSLIATGGWVKSGSIYVSSKYTLSN